MARAVLNTSGGRGKELADLLLKELNLPVGTTVFEVRFAVASEITVKCEYMPEESGEGGRDG